MNNQVYQGLNQYLADTAVMYVKFHNLHWNVIGRQFKSVHEYLETIYDSFALTLDETAEMMKINGKQPLATMKDYLAVTAVKEIESKDYSVDEVLEIALADIVYMQELAEKVRVMADEDGGYDVVAMLEGHLTNFNKTVWFLKAMVQ